MTGKHLISIPIIKTKLKNPTKTLPCIAKIGQKSQKKQKFGFRVMFQTDPNFSCKTQEKLITNSYPEVYQINRIPTRKYER